MWEYNKQEGQAVIVNANTILAIANFGGDEYEGVDLSPELLVKCGFVKGIYVVANKDTNSPTHLYFLGSTMEIARSGIGALQVPCRCLHQLQNLVKAITGVELEIKM